VVALLDRPLQAMSLASASPARTVARSKSTGGPKLGWLNTLNRSTRGLQEKPLVELEMPPRTVRSSSPPTNPFRAFRAKFPCNSIQLAPLKAGIDLPPYATFGFRIHTGTPETRFGRFTM
jgi:hypothetical protein